MERQSVDTTLHSLSGTLESTPADRRSEERMMTVYRVGALGIDERSELCVIKNICPNGMMVRTYCSILEGSRVTIELKCGHPISGVVKWARDAHAGIGFDQRIDVLDVLSTTMDGPRPRKPRIKIDGFVTLREGAFTSRAQLCDISQGGVKLRCEKPPAPNSPVVVTIHGIGPQPSVVCWIDGHYVGIKFHHMLALPVLVEWLRDRQNPLRTERTAIPQSSARA